MLGPHNAWRNGMARTGFSFCFAGKYPNCSNPSFSWENSSPWKREVSTWRSNLGHSSQAWQLARTGSQPEGGCSPLPMRVKPRRGSVLTPLPSQDFTPADGQGDEGCFIREARALGTKENPGAPRSQVQELSALYSGSSEQ